MPPVFFNSRAEPACLVYLGVEQAHSQAHLDNLIQQATCAFSYCTYNVLFLLCIISQLMAVLVGVVVDTL